MNKKNILIVSATNQDSDPRVIRQINFLKDDFEVYCCGVKNSIVSEDRFIRLETFGNTIFSKIITGILKFLRLYHTAEYYMLDVRYNINTGKEFPFFDLIIANDFDTLALTFRTFKSEKVIADFHEYAPSEFEDKLYWKYVNKRYVINQCRKYLPELDETTTVCESIALEYKKEFGILPAVITNASDFHNLKPLPVKEKIRIIHHGAAISSRKIELMTETVSLLDDRFTLDLMLIPNEKDYYEKLKNSVEKNDRINIIEPVGFSQIIPFCNQYDIGLFLLPPVNLNYRYALPNKFFEYIQSRLAVITGPSPEMTAYIDRYSLGIHSETFDPAEIAEKINKLSNEDIMNFKINSDKSAEKLSSEENRKILLELIHKTIN
ncbi:MAG: glycosyltransferase family 4 protein [Ignavibacteria bacterium]|nr:glycosyltransferase family 4 protein [Ignavibacteria bacterium]